MVKRHWLAGHHRTGARPGVDGVDRARGSLCAEDGRHAGAPDPVRRFTGEARILTYLLQRGVPVAVPVLTDDGRVCTTGGDGANDDIPALALAAALGLLAYFIQEHDLVEESWLRAACWIGDNFGTLRLPAGATGG